MPKLNNSQIYLIPVYIINLDVCLATRLSISGHRFDYRNFISRLRFLYNFLFPQRLGHECYFWRNDSRRSFHDLQKFRVEKEGRLFYNKGPEDYIQFLQGHDIQPEGGNEGIQVEDYSRHNNHANDSYRVYNFRLSQVLAPRHLEKSLHHSLDLDDSLIHRLTLYAHAVDLSHHQVELRFEIFLSRIRFGHLREGS